ncbi:IS66 family insertion sequence element accessory protein TnpB, partial [Burkholderia gladioli]
MAEGFFLQVARDAARVNDNGFWLLMKRLEADRFTWPDKKTEVVTMTT